MPYLSWIFPTSSSLPGGNLHVVIGELAPLLPSPSLQLLPIALDLIPVHRPILR